MSRTKKDTNSHNDPKSPASPPLDLRLTRSFPRARKIIILHLFNALATAIGLIATSLLIGYLFQYALDRTGKSASLKLGIIAIGTLLARHIISTSIEQLKGRHLRSVSKSMAVAIIKGTFEHQNHSMKPLEVGLLLSKGLNDIGDYLSQFVGDALAALVITPAAMITLLILTPVGAAFVVVELVLVPPVMILLGKAAQRRANQRAQSLHFLSRRFLDLTTGLLSLRGLGIAKEKRREIVDASQRYRQDVNYGLRVAVLSGAALELLVAIATALVAIEIGIDLSHGLITIHDGVASIVLVPIIFSPIRSASARFHATTDAQQAIRTYYELTKPTETSGVSVKYHVSNAAFLLKADEVTLGIPEADENSFPLSFTIPSTGVVCITGDSGSGKTSLLRVIVGLTEAKSGDLVVNSREHELSKFVGYLPQRPSFVTGTIRQNLTITNPDAQDYRITEMIGRMELEGALKTNNLDLDSLLSNEDVQLSAGERQRLALCRVFLEEKSLYVLDEPTSNLDSETERKIVTIIKEISMNSAVIAATHSAYLIAKADKVISLKSTGQLTRE